MKLAILRGMHDPGMVDEVVSLVEDKDVVFFEYVNTMEQKEALEDILGGLSFDDAYAQSEKVKKFAEWPDAFLRIGYRLRGKHIALVPVDDVLKEGQTVESYVQGMMTYFAGDEVDNFIETGDPEPLYESFEASLRHNAAETRRRDEKVARQIAVMVPMLKERGIKHENIALVQGYVHNSAPFIRKLIPDLEITEQLYNRELTESLARTPLLRMDREKVLHPDKPANRKDIDTFLASIFQGILDDRTVALNIYAAASHHMDNPNIQYMYDLQEAYNKMDADTLHTHLLQLVARMRDQENTVDGAVAAIKSKA